MLFDGVFFQPTRKAYASPRSFGLHYEDCRFASSDGIELHGWFFPSNDPDPLGTLVHVHGNAGNITGHFMHVAWLPSARWNLFCFDYRGYGQSAGRVTRGGLIADTHAAIDYVRQRPGVDPDRIVVLGQSLGGSIAVLVAAERNDMAGVIIDGAFTAYRAIAGWHIRSSPLLRYVAFWVPMFMENGLEPINAIGRISPTPLLIMHGTRDEVVPVSMANALYAAAGEPKDLWLLKGAGHYEAFTAQIDHTRPRLLDFMNRCVNGNITASRSPSPARAEPA
jgi:fermentation-respiration switch protein FrsA (DUF1100 family)